MRTDGIYAELTFDEKFGLDGLRIRAFRIAETVRREADWFQQSDNEDWREYGENLMKTGESLWRDVLFMDDLRCCEKCQMPECICEGNDDE